MTLHYKKDGILDMRYSSSKQAMSSGSPTSSSMSSGVHYKKDGSLDIRHNSSKAATSSTQSNYVNRLPSSTASHHKKDGSLDLRYSSSEAAARSLHTNESNRTPSFTAPQLKNDDSLDIQYSSSSSAQSNGVSQSSEFDSKQDDLLDMGYESCQSTMNSSTLESIYSADKIPQEIPVTKNGISDMRTTVAKEWVKEQGQSRMGDTTPSWLPKTKDGSRDISKVITQEYLQWKDSSSSSNYIPDQRLIYYRQKLEDNLFRNLVKKAREDQVEMPEYQILPKTSTIQRQLSSRAMRSVNPREDNANDDSDLCNEISSSIRLINCQQFAEGSFGIISKCISNKQLVVIKQFDLTRDEKTSFLKQFQIMLNFNEHPNFVHFYGYTFHQPFGLIMKYLPLGSLNDLLYDCQDSQIEAKLTDGRIKKRLLLGISLGMIQLHRMQIIHGDLKPQKILVSLDYSAKITDFPLTTSSSQALNDDDCRHICGTTAYMAPELLINSNSLEYSCDVYSFGILFNELIQEEEPYAEQLGNFRGRGRFAAVHYAKLGHRPRISSRISTFLKHFIQKCWNRDRRNRPLFEQIFNDVQPFHVKFPHSFDLI